MGYYSPFRLLHQTMGCVLTLVLDDPSDLTWQAVFRMVTTSRIRGTRCRELQLQVQEVELLDAMFPAPGMLFRLCFCV